MGSLRATVRRRGADARPRGAAVVLSNEFGPRRASVGIRFSGIRRDRQIPAPMTFPGARQPDGELLDGDARSCMPQTGRRTLVTPRATRSMALSYR